MTEASILKTKLFIVARILEREIMKWKITKIKTVLFCQRAVKITQVNLRILET